MIPIDSSPLCRDGKVLILAYDHGLEHGPADFRELPERADPGRIFDIATHSAVTSIAVQKGIAEAYYPSYEDEMSLLLKLNGTSNLWMGEPDSAVISTVEQAVDIGASSVGFTVYGGSNHEIEMVEEFAAAQQQARAAGVPMVMWSYPRGQGLKSDTDPDTIAYAARLALELGADVAKIKYPGSAEAMTAAVRMAGPTKVIMSGGSKASDRAFLTDVAATMEAGGAGLAVGRNVWQRENPAAILDALELLIFESGTVDEALAMLD